MISRDCDELRAGRRRGLVSLGCEHWALSENAPQERYEDYEDYDTCDYAPTNSCHRRSVTWADIRQIVSS